jgi:hypothetical protein
MATTVKTRLDIKSWDEKPYRELPDGRKFTRAEVVLSGGEGDVQLDATWEALLYYEADGTSTYVGIMHATGTLYGRKKGSFVTEGRGTFDGSTAKITSTIVPGSGTGALKGISGKVKHQSTHADYPHWPMTITYTIE